MGCKSKLLASLFEFKDITFCNLATKIHLKIKMKLILRLLLAINSSGLLFGYYIKSTNEQRGDFYIGLSVLMLAFVLLPFFLYTRFKDKKLSQYMFPKEPPKQKESQQ